MAAGIALLQFLKTSGECGPAINNNQDVPFTLTPSARPEGFASNPEFSTVPTVASTISSDTPLFADDVKKESDYDAI